MTTTNLPLYRLLVKFGASDAEAEAAVIADESHLATKADLAELEARLQRWTIQTMGVLTGIYLAISVALKFVR
jgi:hypothetical protein